MTDAETRLRYHIILLAVQGYTAPQIARLILRSDDMVLQVLKRFRAGGLEAVLCWPFSPSATDQACLQH